MRRWPLSEGRETWPPVSPPMSLSPWPWTMKGAAWTP